MGPALSEFEMSSPDATGQARQAAAAGERDAARQPAGPRATASWKVLQPGRLGLVEWRWPIVPGAPAAGKPGLCISYPGSHQAGLLRQPLDNTSKHLNGCYTDAELFKALKLQLHPNQCDPATVKIPVLPKARSTGTTPVEPFDNYVLKVASGPGRCGQHGPVHRRWKPTSACSSACPCTPWVTMLMPDDTPFDRFMDDNPDAFVTFGEANETAPGRGHPLVPADGRSAAVLQGGRQLQRDAEPHREGQLSGARRAPRLLVHSPPG
jgi:hypothetical protein